MNKQSQIVLDLVTKIQDIVNILRENDMEPELAVSLILSMYKTDKVEKVETTENDVEEEKKELTIEEARKEAEEDSKGYSYFGKWYTNRKTLQSELRLYGKEIDLFITKMMSKGYSIRDSIEEYVSVMIFGDIEEEIYGHKVRISDFCRLNDIPMGIIRARKLEKKSSYKEEILKYMSQKKIEPKFTDRYNVEELKKHCIVPEKDKVKKIEVDRPIFEYNGIDYYNIKRFFTTYFIKGANGVAVMNISKEKDIDVGKAADIWLEEKFNRCEDVELNGIVYENLSALLRFFDIPFCEFWLFCRQEDYRGKEAYKEAIKCFKSFNPKFFESHKISAQDRLKEPCEYNGEKFSNGMELFKKFGIGLSFGISTMQERNLSPVEVVEFHLQGDDIKLPKDNRTNPKYEPKGKQKLLEQSYTKIRSKRTEEVEYQGKKYSSKAEALDDLGMYDERSNITYRMTKKGMTFEEAVDDVLVNKKNSGRKKKDEGNFVYANVTYTSLNEACKCYDLRESKVRNYAYDYGVNLNTAFGILVGDIKETDCGIKKKRMYQENVWV